MAKVLKLGIAKNENQKIQEVQDVDVLIGKGIVGDRHFKENNDLRNQITLIESENIDFYNKKFNTTYDYLDFRRNIVTKGIQLNEMIGKKLLIGNIEIKGHDLCRPCRDLEENLNGKDIIKEFLRKGGLRCEILISGKIKTGDEIKII